MGKLTALENQTRFTERHSYVGDWPAHGHSLCTLWISTDTRPGDLNFSLYYLYVHILRLLAEQTYSTLSEHPNGRTPMFRITSRLLLILAGVVCAAGLGTPEAEGGFLIRSWYVDRHFPLHHHATAYTPCATCVVTQPCCTCRRPSCQKCASTSCQGCAKATTGNAFLYLEVPDDADVKINGRITAKQKLAGVHTGTRVYSLVKLSPGEHRTYAIEAKEAGWNVWRTTTFAAKAGDEKRFKLTEAGIVEVE